MSDDLRPIVFFSFVDENANKVKVILSDSKDDELGEASYFCFDILEQSIAPRANDIYKSLLKHLAEDNIPDMGEQYFHMKNIRQIYKKAGGCFADYPKGAISWRSKYPEYMLDDSFNAEDKIPESVKKNILSSIPTYIVTPDPDRLEQIINYTLGPKTFQPHMHDLFVTSDKKYEENHQCHVVISDNENGKDKDWSELMVMDPLVDKLVIFDHKNEYFKREHPFDWERLPSHRKLIYISTYEMKPFPMTPIFCETYADVMRHKNKRPITVLNLDPNEGLNSIEEIVGEDYTLSLWSRSIVDKINKPYDSSLSNVGINAGTVMLYQDLPKVGVFLDHLMDLSEYDTKCVILLGNHKWDEFKPYYAVSTPGIWA
jgi:hypothetical protein